MRRQALIAGQQRPMVQEAAVISAGCTWLFPAVLCLFARPDSRDSVALWASITAVHVAALLLSWLAFRDASRWRCCRATAAGPNTPRGQQPRGGEMA